MGKPFERAAYSLGTTAWPSIALAIDPIAKRRTGSRKGAQGVALVSREAGMRQESWLGGWKGPDRALRPADDHGKRKSKGLVTKHSIGWGEARGAHKGGKEGGFH